jgi:hypothetical protein
LWQVQNCGGVKPVRLTSITRLNELALTITIIIQHGHMMTNM